MNNKLQLSLVDFIDRGGQNDIFLAQENGTDNKYILKKAQVKKNPKFEQYLMEEAHLFQKLADVEGLIGYHGITSEIIPGAEPGASMILEYSQYGSLQ
jgi:hypothetical protein